MFEIVLIICCLYFVLLVIHAHASATSIPRADAPQPEIKPFPEIDYDIIQTPLTPLQREFKDACAAGNLKLIKKMVKRHAEEALFTTPCYILSAYEGREDVLKILMKKFDPDTFATPPTHALLIKEFTSPSGHRYSAEQKVNAVKLLIASGASPNSFFDRQSLLFRTVSMQLTDLVHFLLDKNANMYEGTRDHFSIAPAIVHQSARIIVDFIRHGFDIRRRDVFGKNLIEYIYETNSPYQFLNELYLYPEAQELVTEVYQVEVTTRGYKINVEKWIRTEDISTLQTYLDKIPGGANLPVGGYGDFISCAVHLNKLAVVRFLYQNRIRYQIALIEDPRLVDIGAHTCAEGRLELAQYFATEEKWFSDERNGNRRQLSCLVQAAMHGQSGLLRNISSLGFSIDGTTPLATFNVLVGPGDYTPKERALGLEALLENGANASAHNGSSSLLGFSAELNNVPAVRTLLKFAANMYHANQHGWLPIFWAGYHASTEMLSEFFRRQFNWRLRFLFNQRTDDFIGHVAHANSTQFPVSSQLVMHTPNVTKAMLKELHARLSDVLDKKNSEIDWMMITVIAVVLLFGYNGYKLYIDYQAHKRRKETRLKAPAQTEEKRPDDKAALELKKKQEDEKRKALKRKKMEEKLKADEEERQKKQLEEEKRTAAIQKELEAEWAADAAANEAAEAERKATEKVIKDKAEARKKANEEKRLAKLKEQQDKDAAEKLRIQQAQDEAIRAHEEKLKAKAEDAKKKAQRKQTRQINKALERAPQPKEAVNATVVPSDDVLLEFKSFAQYSLENALDMALVYKNACKEDRKNEYYHRNMRTHHFALLYYIHRAYLAISLHKENVEKVREDLSADLSANLRDMLMHKGAIETTTDKVFQSARELLVILPKDIAELTRARSLKKVLPEKEIKALFQLSNVPERVTQEEYLRKRISDTPLYVEAKRQHRAHEKNPQYDDDRTFIHWITHVMVPNINLLAATLLKTVDTVATPRSQFAETLDALRMAFTMCGDLYSDERNLRFQTEHKGEPITQFLSKCREVRNRVAHHFPDVEDSIIIKLCRTAKTVNKKVTALDVFDFSYAISHTLFGQSGATQSGLHPNPTALPSPGSPSPP